jgi:hypothetical protein
MQHATRRGEPRPLERSVEMAFASTVSGGLLVQMMKQMSPLRGSSGRVCKKKIKKQGITRQKKLIY